jgi:hypothetical protein
VSTSPKTINKKDKSRSHEDTRKPPNHVAKSTQVKVHGQVESSLPKREVVVTKTEIVAKPTKSLHNGKEVAKKPISTPKLIAPKPPKPQQLPKKSDNLEPSKPLTDGTSTATKAITNGTAATVKNGKETSNGTKKPSLTVNGQMTPNTSLGTNTPRRRSSDKKALTIKEGLMRTGDFVVSMEESKEELPMIWRIEGKSLLQRFEPIKQDDGLTVYVNTSSYSAWNPTVRTKYRGVDVRIMGCSRTRIVVEKLGLTKTPPVNGTAPPVVVNGNVVIVEGVTTEITEEQEPSLENFEVYIQTLVSQALDPNFIAEIVKENDDYFLSNVQAIEDVCSKKKTKFTSRIKWDANITKCIESFPSVSCQTLKNEHDLRCRLCQENWATNMFSFSGDFYDPLTLVIREVCSVDSIKQTKYASCDSCKSRVLSFSRLHHSKYHFFVKCQRKVSLSILMSKSSLNNFLI